MKYIITLLAFLISFFSGSSMATQTSGNWRGQLELAPGVSLILGIEIIEQDDGVVVYLDSPNQGMENHEVEDVALTDDSLSFSAPKLNASFTGKFDGDTLNGVFTQGRERSITLTRLSAEQSQQLVNETRWFGDLQVSPNTGLPLVVAIAVGADGYHVTLDSPQQQSFGIPTTDVTLTEDTLSFDVPMIGASYSATREGEAFVGTFVQGAAMPLTLKKKQP